MPVRCTKSAIRDHICGALEYIGQCPLRVEPRGIIEPFAWDGNATCATAVTIAGYATPVTNVMANNRMIAGRI